MRAAAGLAGVSGLAAAAFGAFGAHGVADLQAKAWLETGSTYQLAHALAALAALWLASRGGRGAGAAAWCFLAGASLFAGALYGLAFGAPRLLGAVAPIGGVLFMIGWALLAWAGWTLPAKGREPR